MALLTPHGDRKFQNDVMRLNNFKQIIQIYVCT